MVFKISKQKFVAELCSTAKLLQISWPDKSSGTRLISFESQPKKIVVIPVFDTRNIPLKFGCNQVINRWDVVDVVVVSVFVEVVVVDPKNLLLKLG